MMNTPRLLRARSLRNLRPTIRRQVAIRAVALLAGFIAFGPTPALAEGRVYNQPEDVEHSLVTSGVGVPTGAVIFGKDA